MTSIIGWIFPIVINIIGKFYFDINNTCIINCPPNNYWENSANNTCESCDESCLTCSNSTAVGCLTCDNGRFFYYTNSTCLINCPPNNYWENSTNNTCQFCDISCLACSNSTDIGCLTCDNGRFFLDSNTSCLPNCPLYKYWENITNNTCQ